MQFRTHRAGMFFGLALALLVPALPASADPKIALLDSRRAVFSSNGGKEVEKTLTQLQAKKKSELEPRNATCKKQQEDIESQRFVLSEDALRDKMIEAQSCQRDLERDFQSAQDELKVQQSKLMAPLMRKLEDAVKEIGKAKEFDLVLDRTTPGVLYASDALDITEIVIKKLNGN